MATVAVDVTLAQARALITLSERLMAEARAINDADAYEMAYSLRHLFREAARVMDDGKLP